MTPRERIDAIYEHIQANLDDWHARLVLAHEYSIVGDRVMAECQAWMVENKKYPTNNIWWHAKEFGFFSSLNNDTYSVTVNPEEVDVFPGGGLAKFVNGKAPIHSKIPAEIFDRLAPKEDGRGVCICTSLAILERRLAVALNSFFSRK